MFGQGDRVGINCIGIKYKYSTMSTFLKIWVMDTWEFIMLFFACFLYFKYFIINQTNTEGNIRTPGTADK